MRSAHPPARERFPREPWSESARMDMEDAGDAPRRVSVKRVPWTRDAAARRRATLAGQRQARRDLTAHARALAGGADGDVSSQSEDEDSMEGEAAAARSEGGVSKRRTREDRVKRRRERFCRQLMVPEWMVDTPRDLNGSGSATGGGWYVLPRPEGKRCLVVASSGRTIARIQSGSVLRKFPSALPGGSHKTNRGNDAYCILDCIFQEQNATFYVLDVMCWKSYLLYNCTTEFRWYWARDKLAEGATDVVAPANPYRFLVRRCGPHAHGYFWTYTREPTYKRCYAADSVLRERPSGHSGGLRDHIPIHQVRQPFQTNPVSFMRLTRLAVAINRDGLLFYLKAAHYEMDLSPLALVWKDHVTSRYFVYTEKPSIVLRLDTAREFTTLEGIALHTVDEAFVLQHEVRLRRSN
jgi:snurportin-1